MREKNKVDMPLVSVIIPVYKAERYLEACVKSVLNQTYNNLKIYLINDGSPDKSPEICDRFALENLSIYTVHKKNEGAASARNVGLSIMSKDTEYVIFLDSDDTLLPEAIFGLVQMGEKTGADIIMPDRYIKKNEGENREEITSLFPANLRYPDPIAFAVNVMIEQGRAWRASALLYKNSVIAKSSAKFPIGHTAEDYIFNLEIMQHANKIAFYLKPTLINLKHSGSVTSTFNEEFGQTIRYIDQRTREFLLTIESDEVAANKKADALLYRNIIVYLFSIMSAKEFSMMERRKKAKELLTDNEISKGVLNKKFKTPYFNNKLARLIMPVIYTLTRYKQHNMTIRILSLIYR